MPLFPDVASIAGGLRAAAGRVADLGAARAEAASAQKPAGLFGRVFSRLAATERARAEAEARAEQRREHEEHWHQDELQIPVHHDDEDEADPEPAPRYAARTAVPSPLLDEDDDLSGRDWIHGT